jgi:hypothetical protein
MQNCRKLVADFKLLDTIERFLRRLSLAQTAHHAYARTLGSPYFVEHIAAQATYTCAASALH